MMLIHQTKAVFGQIIKFIYIAGISNYNVSGSSIR
jgi:hypothetical protein